MQYRTSVILNLIKLWEFENRKFLYRDCRNPGCIGKSNTNNLPASTDLNENPYGKFFLFKKDATQKSARVVLCGIAIELEPREPIFEKCSHLREKA